MRILLRIDKKLYRMYLRSRATFKPEKNYHSYELEALDVGIVESQSRLKYNFNGKKIKIIPYWKRRETRAYTPIRMMVVSNSRVWHRGSSTWIQNNHVDAPTRAPSKDAWEMNTACLKVSKAIIDEADWLFSIPLQDKKIQSSVTDMKLEKMSHNDVYVIEHYRLFRNIGTKLLWVIRKQLQFHILYECHNKAAQMFTDKTISRIFNLFWFTRMHNSVKSYIKSCVGWALRF